MTRITISSIALAAALVLMSDVRAASAQTPLTTARELYAAANYGEALNALNDLSAPAASDAGTVALYRALCLYGLGRSGDGDHAVETLVAEHPLYHPPLEELPPRIRTTVLETRRRLLPVLLQQQYSNAKSAYDHQDFAAAVAGFASVLTGLDDADIAAAASQPPLADLKTLASGFRDLAQKALAPPVVAATAVPVIVPAPVVPAAPRLYTADDANVVGPVPVRQAIPPYGRTVVQRKTGIVQLVITETGQVEAAAMVTPLDPQYDRAVLAAARNWVYQPARVDGVPVKYQKRVQIALVPTPPESSR